MGNDRLAETTAYYTGCRDSLGQLYHHHQPWLQQLLSRRLGCGESALTPLGTRFSVRQRQADELLAVFDGAVAIHTYGDADHDSQWQVVDAGQQVSYSANGISELTSADGP